MKMDVLSRVRDLGVAASVFLAGASALRFFDIDNIAALALASVAPWLLAVVLLVVCAMFGKRQFTAAVVALVLAAGLAMPGAAIPRTGCDVTNGRGSTDLVIYSHNVLHSTAEIQSVAKQVRSVDADVVFLQEAGEPFADALEAALGSGYSHRADEGPISVLSRLPLVDVEYQDSASESNGALIASVSGPFGSLRFANVHAIAPMGGLRPMQRAQFEELATLKGQGVDVLMGDFNSAPQHVMFRDLLVAGGYVDAHRSVGCGFGVTWSGAPGIGPAHLAIDHALIGGNDFVAEEFQVLSYAGSDHKAIATRLSTR